MNNKKVIWIINQYAATPETRQGGRHYQLARNLAALGYDTYLIMANYTHYTKGDINFKGDIKIKNSEKNLNFVWVKVPKYVHAHSKQRVLNWFIFAAKLLKLKDTIVNPDIIIYSSPSLIGYLSAERVAKRLKIPIAFEVRDIWPLTLLQIGGYKERHPFISLLSYIEKRAYKNSDLVISNLKYSYKHMVSKGLSMDKFHWIPNGISIASMLAQEAAPASAINSIPKDKFIVGYAGTIGEANAMKYFIEAASILKENKDIHFVIVGKGKSKDTLLRLSEELSLDNITFINPVIRSQVQSIISNFNACYIGWHNKPLYNYGVAANKIPEYMYSGKPIIHSFSGRGDLVEEAKAGISIEAENSTAIANAILDLYSMSDIEREKMGIRGKQFVIDNLTYEKLADKLEQVLFRVKDNNEIKNN